MSFTADENKQVPRVSLTAAVTHPEAFLAMVLAALLLLSLVISAVKSQPVAWAGFVLSPLPTVGLFAAGIYIRLVKNQPRIAKLAIANSLFLGFMGLTSLVIYLRFPIGELSFDRFLIKADSLVGYSWPAIVESVAAVPAIGKALGYVYHSSLIQLFGMILYLALSGRLVTLDRAMLAGTLSLLFTTIIWWVAPSVGPSVFYSIPLEIQQSIGLFSGDNYADLLRRLAEDGLAVIRTDDIVGTIAFPSYHTVMALVVVWYMRGTNWFLPVLVLNTAMIPAILSHGGHHLTDMVGGILVFAMAAWIAARPWFGRAAE